LTYAVAAPESMFGSLRQAYLSIHDMLRRALQQLGASASLAAAPSRLTGVDGGACFAQPVGGEVLIGGRKVVGSAQIRRAGGLLQHGSILIDDDQSFLAQITKGDAPTGGEIPLNRVLDPPVTVAQVAEAVVEAAETWGTPWGTDDRSRERTQLAQSRFDHFRWPEWTWRR